MNSPQFETYKDGMGSVKIMIAITRISSEVDASVRMMCFVHLEKLKLERKALSACLIG